MTVLGELVTGAPGGPPMMALAVPRTMARVDLCRGRQVVERMTAPGAQHTMVPAARAMRVPVAPAIRAREATAGGVQRFVANRATARDHRLNIGQVLVAEQAAGSELRASVDRDG